MYYLKEFEIKWADLDPNRHARHSIFTDYATHVRFTFLTENGFGMDDFQSLNIGPVIFSEQIYYLREVLGTDIITIDLKLGGISKDGSLWKFIHNVYKNNNKKAVSIILQGGWIDLKTRKLVPAPKELFRALLKIPKTKIFEEIQLKRNYLKEVPEFD
jgi:acyl-CoA thioester hydrolase